MCGINEDSFQKRLLSETKLTYDSAVKKVLAMEVAMENPKEMQASKKQVEEEIESGEQVHTIQQQRQGRPSWNAISVGTQTTLPTVVDLRMPNVLIVVNRATSPEFVVVRKEDQCR